jgi:asparagine synthase (glutamine-hydrolysing)
MYLLAKLTKQHVTVALSGDGGDELFAGYNRHLQIEKLWKLRSLPFSKTLAKMLSVIPPRFLATRIADTRTDGTDKALKLLQILSENSEENAVNAILSQWSNSESEPLVPHVPSRPATRLLDRQHWLTHAGPREQMQYLDALVYLPDDILVKVDRACMAVSLESRAPFLDHRVVEFAWTLPATFKVKSGVGKHILREVLHSYVPSALFTHEKMGFALPLNPWLKGPLREWSESFLEEKKLNQNGLNGRLISRLWREHLCGTRDAQHLLWNVLMLRSWQEKARA